VHLATGTLRELLALMVTPANEHERAQIAELTRAVQEATGKSVEVAYGDQGYACSEPAQAAQGAGIEAGGGQAAGSAARGKCCCPGGG
jgi:hypothetical protein